MKVFGIRCLIVLVFLLVAVPYVFLIGWWLWLLGLIVSVLYWVVKGNFLTDWLMDEGMCLFVPFYIVNPLLDKLDEMEEKQKKVKENKNKVIILDYLKINGKNK